MIKSAEEFKRLRTSEDLDEQRLAAHSEAALEVWHDIVNRMPDMHEWVAQNKTVPVEILERLAREGDRDTRYLVASKRKLPEYLQLEMLKDPDAGVRDRLAWNAKATKRVLELLTEDPHEEVRAKARERLGEAS